MSYDIFYKKQIYMYLFKERVIKVIYVTYIMSVRID